MIPFLYGYGSGSGSGNIINYGSDSGSDLLARYGSGSGSGSASQKVMVPTVPVPQRWLDWIRIEQSLDPDPEIHQKEKYTCTETAECNSAETHWLPSPPSLCLFIADNL